MTWRPDAPAADSYIPTGARHIRENWRVLESVFGADYFTSGRKFETFAVGTKLWFYQDTAPDGWSVVTTAADCLIGCKTADGTGVYTTGGVEAGTWEQTEHALTIDEMPSHTHQTPRRGICGSNPGNPIVFWCDNYASDQQTQPTGGNQPHSHGDTWRPLAAVGIICQKL